MEFTGFALRSIRSSNSIEYLKGAKEIIEKAEDITEFDRQMLLKEADKRIDSLKTINDVPKS